MHLCTLKHPTILVKNLLELQLKLLIPVEKIFFSYLTGIFNFCILVEKVTAVLCKTIS
jgi:hypothetical protein